MGRVAVWRVRCLGGNGGRGELLIERNGRAGACMEREGPGGAGGWGEGGLAGGMA